MQNPPFKTVVLYNRGHLGSMIVLNRLLKMKCYDITAVVRTNNVPFSRKGLKKIKKHMARSGFFFMLMLGIQQFVQELFFLIPHWTRTIKTSKELKKRHSFHIHDTENINSAETLSFLKNESPDIILSAYFPYILKRESLEIAKKGVINIHPGLIPDYKGVMAYFWALKNNSPKAGVSLHRMDEGIDTGPVIAMKSFTIPKKMSQDKLLIKTAIIGSTLLHQVGQSMRQGKQLEILSTDGRKKSYYSVPKHKDFLAYRKFRSFFSIRAILKVIIGL